MTKGDLGKMKMVPCFFFIFISLAAAAAPFQKNKFPFLQHVRIIPVLTRLKAVVWPWYQTVPPQYRFNKNLGKMDGNSLEIFCLS